MSPVKRPRPKRSGIETEEERAWVEFYQRVRSDAVLATEVLAQLDKDDVMKRSHLALFLTCKETIRREKAREARNKRIGRSVRWLIQMLLVRPLESLRIFGGSARDIAIEMLPEASSSSRAEPRALGAVPVPSSSSPAKARRPATPSRRGAMPLPEAGAGAEAADKTAP